VEPGLPRGRWSLEIGLAGTQARIQHVATCPEVAPAECAEQELPAHQHDQTLSWLRLDPRLTLGLGGGWQAGLQLPMDLRQVRVDYLTLDGAPYNPPYGDIHHRDELLWGPVDGQLSLRKVYSRSPRAFWAWTGTLGLPIGATQPDPYAAAERQEEHQHIQLGTGTFQPGLVLDGWRGGSTWGLAGQAIFRASVYENGHGYRPPQRGGLSLGPTWRSQEDWLLSGRGELTAEGSERWGGESHGGLILAMAALDAQRRLEGSELLMGLRMSLWQRGFEQEDDQIAQRALVQVGWRRSWGGSPFP
jgi:hypothetical protein